MNSILRNKNSFKNLYLKSNNSDNAYYLITSIFKGFHLFSKNKNSKINERDIFSKYIVKAPFFTILTTNSNKSGQRINSSNKNKIYSVKYKSFFGGGRGGGGGGNQKDYYSKYIFNKKYLD